MKLNGFKKFNERRGFDDIDTYSGYEDFYDWEEFNDSGYLDKGYKKNQDDHDNQDDEIEHLHYLLRQMFKNAGISNVDIGGKGVDSITVDIHLNYKDKLSNLIEIMEVVNKINKDVLVDYQCEVDMWRTKNYKPLLSFNFMYEGFEDEAPPF